MKSGWGVVFACPKRQHFGTAFLLCGRFQKLGHKDESHRPQTPTTSVRKTGLENQGTAGLRMDAEGQKSACLLPVSLTFHTLLTKKVPEIVLRILRMNS